MASLKELLSAQGPERIQALLSACPRRAREEVYRGLKIKGRAPARGFRLKSSTDNRADQFYERLTQDEGIPDDLLVELVRNYLFSCRGLLADALTFLDVPHKDGLTDNELDHLKELPAEKGAALATHLEEKGHEKADIELYLQFMAIPH